MSLTHWAICLPCEAEGEGDAPPVVRHVAAGRIDGDGDDLLRRGVRHLLDVHAARRAGNECDARRCTVDQCRQVELALDVDTVRDVDAVDGTTARSRLRRDQRCAQHLLGEGLHLGTRAGEAHTALLARRSFLELALAAAAGVDLRLDDEQRPGKLLRRLAGLTHRKGNPAVRCRDAELAQQFLGLMLVDVHAVLLFGGAVASARPKRRAAGRSWCRRRRGPSPTRPT